MKKNIVATGFVPLVGILLLMMLAYAHSFQVSKMYDERMRQDIQRYAQELTSVGVADDHVKVFRSIMLNVSHNTLSFIASETSNVVGAFSVMGIIVMSFSLALASRINALSKE